MRHPEPQVDEVTEYLVISDNLHLIIGSDERVRVAGARLSRGPSRIIVSGLRERVEYAISTMRTILQEFEALIPITLTARGRFWELLNPEASMAFYAETRCILTPLPGGTELRVQGRPQDFSRAITLIADMVSILPSFNCTACI